MVSCRTVLLIAIFLIVQHVSAQIAPGIYRVSFTDKGPTTYSFNQPLDFLAQRAVDRRLAHGVSIDSLDIPVNPTYIQQLMASTQMDVIHASKWFNSVTIRSTDTLGLDTLYTLPFVASVRTIARKANRPQAEKLEGAPKSEVGGYYSGYYGGAYRQVTMLNTHLLHDEGAQGQGMLIGVLDSGFENADSIAAFNHLFEENRIVFTRDVADKEEDVFDDHDHGMSVLSTMAALDEGTIVGTAPAAGYVLIRTEVDGSEFLWEEDNWAVGAEICDSIGCDILNTSLGYTTFDDSTMDHSYADMDGQTTLITRAAAIACAKGMLPVNSVGNSGNSDWNYIGAPADAAGVLSIGAVQRDRSVAEFSSHGPTADGRIKPDVSALGEGAWGLHRWGIGLINGTSFSGPIVAGSVACLWQLHPDRTNIEIMDAVRASAHLHDDPDNDQGFGVPDFFIAHQLLSDKSVLRDSNILMDVFPNPFDDHFTVQLFSETATSVRMEMFELTGQKFMDRTIDLDRQHLHRIRVEAAELSAQKRGAYALRVTMGGLVMYRLLVKE
jgi:subtilisin family serine protease